MALILALRPYLLAFAAGLGAAVVFALFGLSNPAPPWPALAGLLGILGGERVGAVALTAVRRRRARRRDLS
jgi:XapX domain-containing protein